MQIAMRAEINFHKQNEASVFLESASDREHERLGEMLLFSLVAARVFVNLGGVGQPAARLLAQLLTEGGGGTDEEFRQFVAYEPADGVRLVEYPGSRGSKQLRATVSASDDRLNFKLKTRGLLRGAGYYSPNAVLILLRYLAQERSQDTEFMLVLGQGTYEIGSAALGGQVTMTSQAEVAMRCSSYAWDMFFGR